MNEHTTTIPSATTTITGVAAVAGPLLLLGSTVAYLTQGGGLNEGELGGAIQVWAFIALGVAVLGLARTLERSAPSVAAALGVLGVIAAAVGSGYGIDSIQAAVFDTGTLMETESAAVPVALMIPGLVAPLTLFVLGVTLASTGAAPRPLGWMLAVGAVLFPVSRIPDIEAVALTSDLLVVASMVPIGLRLLGGRTTGAPIPAAQPSAA